MPPWKRVWIKKLEETGEDLNATPDSSIPFGYKTGWLCVQSVEKKEYQVSQTGSMKFQII